MKFDLISREDAHAQGRKRFYTGKPCKYGHDAQRFVTTGNCVACNAARSKAFATSKNSERGKFNHPLHPDDYAAARAYCQALDLARGLVPYVDPVAMPAPKAAAPVAIHADIERHRQALIDGPGILPPTSDAAERKRRELLGEIHAPRNLQPHMPKP